MKLRALTITALLLAAPAWSRVIVDDTAPEQPAETGIHVASPNDDTAKSAPLQDSLSFLNKDQLHGLLLGIDQNTGIRWQSLEAGESILFKTNTVSEIKLDAHPPPATAAFAQRVALTNGDEFPGNIISLDDKTLVFDTWYAGRLSIPRAMLRRITPVSDSDSVVYQGPAGLDGWTVGHVGLGRSWTYRDGAFIGTNFGTIGRDVNLPDMSNIAFDVALRGNGQFSISIYSDRTDNSGNCYMLMLTNGYTALQRFSRLGGSNDLGSTQMLNIIRHDKSRVELRTDKAKKTIWLLIDHKIVKEWNDPGDFNGDGHNIIFACQPGTYVKISNIIVSKWNGKFDDSSNATPAGEQDSVQLANEDKVSGRLESIQDGKAKLASAYAELNIPLDRISQLDLAASHSDQAKPNPSDVRAYFPEGGSVTMQLYQWDTRACTGYSPNFGQASFSPNAFTRILFNLPAQQQNQDSDDSNPDSDSPDQGDHD
jgi:hypothetical protein